MTTRETVWLEAWKTALSRMRAFTPVHASDLDEAVNSEADACLKAFDERFPQHDSSHDFPTLKPDQTKEILKAGQCYIA